MNLNIDKIILNRLNMTLKHPFNTSFGMVQDKDFFIIEIHDNNNHVGYGESVAFSSPWYTEETTETTLHMMRDFLIPLIKNANISHPRDVTTIFKQIRGNNMAKAAIETAIWDLYAKQLNMPLHKLINGTQKHVDAGVSIGIQPDTNKLIDIINQHINNGIKRVKIKIKKNHDLDVIDKIRTQFPTLSLMVDANSAYTLDDLEHLKKFDQYNLLMMEQPLGHDDIYEHSILQKQLSTPLCLDESIYSLEDVILAHQLGSCKVINLKLGRVGGLNEAIKIHDYCLKNNIDLWSGGMLEAGVGRAHNIALSSLPGFNLPSDTGSSSQYWHKDIISPEVILQDGTIEVNNNPGIGYQINAENLNEYIVDRIIFHIVTV